MCRRWELCRRAEAGYPSDTAVAKSSELSADDGRLPPAIGEGASEGGLRLKYFCKSTPYLNRDYSPRSKYLRKTSGSYYDYSLRTKYLHDAPWFGS
jgi:hypothetical protein